MGNRPSVNFTRENQNQGNMLLTFNVAQEKQEDVWFLDLGCSNHMTGNIAMFSNIDESVKSEVITGTHSKVSIMGKGRLKILTKKGEKKFVPDVYYVLSLKCNLISIGKLLNKGYNVFFKNDVCTIMDIPPSRQVIEKVHMTSNRMFPLKIKTRFKEGGVVVVVTQDVFQE